MITDSSLLTSTAWDSSSLNELKSRVRQQPQSEEAQLAVARQTEGMFIQMMLKSMREALPKDDLLSSEQTRLYTSLYDQQIAQQISAKGTGLADMMLKQMSSASVTDPQATPPAKMPVKFDLQTVISYHNQSLSQIVRRAVPDIPASGNILSADNRQFLMQLAHPARVLSEQSGIPQRLILAQAALESGWGQRQIRKTSGEASFNLFGIKASADWKGPVTEVITTEYENGVAKKVKAKFRVYHSYLESLADYVRLLVQNPRYAKVVTAQTPQQAAHALQHAGYATDPAYANKLNAIIGQINSLHEKLNKTYNNGDLLNLF